MGSILQLTLGVVTAMGGFIDIGELVFSVQAGVKFQYLLLWAVVIGTLGIILFSEMSGRVAAVIKKPTFLLVKEQLPQGLSLTVLIASTVLNALTCAAELGGVAIALQLLTGLSDLSTVILAVAAFILIVWVLPFEFIERFFGILGMFMVVFIAAVFASHIDLKQAASGLIPALPPGGLNNLPTYLYFAVGIISSSMMPYEVYFYSSGAVEEGWTPKDLLNNKLTAGIGMSLGSLLSISLIILGHQILGPSGITPQLHGTAALLASIPFGKAGLYLALLGIIFAIGGAAVETCLAGAYNLSQYFGWSWGRYKKPEQTPKFTFLWLGFFLLAFLIMMLGIDPVQLVEYAVIFSVLALPFTYFPLLKVSGDKKIMGQHRNGRIVSILGWIYLGIVTVIAISAVPLMILSNMGQN